MPNLLTFRRNDGGFLSFADLLSPAAGETDDGVLYFVMRDRGSDLWQVSAYKNAACDAHAEVASGTAAFVWSAKRDVVLRRPDESEFGTIGVVRPLLAAAESGEVRAEVVAYYCFAQDAVDLAAALASGEPGGKLLSDAAVAALAARRDEDGPTGAEEAARLGKAAVDEFLGGRIRASTVLNAGRPVDPSMIVNPAGLRWPAAIAGLARYAALHEDPSAQRLSDLRDKWFSSLTIHRHELALSVRGGGSLG